MGKKSAENLVAAIEQAKSRPLRRLVHALGIRHVGETVAERLASGVSSLQQLATMSQEQLVAISGIGPVVARSVSLFFSQDATREVIGKLERFGVNLAGETVRGSGQLAGRVFVLTGGLESMSREQAKERIESLGGKVASSVSRKTDWVVAGSDPGTKLDRARELARPVIDEKAFLALLEGVSSAPKPT